MTDEELMRALGALTSANNNGLFGSRGRTTYSPLNQVGAAGPVGGAGGQATLPPAGLSMHDMMMALGRGGRRTDLGGGMVRSDTSANDLSPAIRSPFEAAMDLQRQQQEAERMSRFSDLSAQSARSRFSVIQNPSEAAQAKVDKILEEKYPEVKLNEGPLIDLRTLGGFSSPAEGGSNTMPTNIPGLGGKGPGTDSEEENLE